MTPTSMIRGSYSPISLQKEELDVAFTTRNGGHEELELLQMPSSSTQPPQLTSYFKEDQPYEAEALEPIEGWLKTSNSQEKGKDDVENSFPAQDLEPSVWTFSAKLFICLISLFVAVTSVPVLAIMILQSTVSKRYGVILQQTGVRGNWLLQPQSIFSEFVMLGAAIHAIRTRNMVAILAVLCFNIYLVVAGFLEAAQRRSDLESYQFINGKTITEFYVSSILLWVIPSLDLCFHIGCDWSALKIYRELGWLAYKKSSADVALSKLYHNVLILRSLALFGTVFAFLEFYTMAVLTIAVYPIAVKNIEAPPRPAEVKAANVCTAVLVACWTFGLGPLYVGMKRESRRLLGISLGIQTLGIVAHFSSLAILVDLVDTAVKAANVSGLDAFAASEANQWKTYFQFATISALLLLNLVWSIIVLRGFGKGLKEREESQIQGVNRRTIEELDLSA